MELEINRLDHYGVVAGVIKDLKIIEQVDSLLGIHEQSEISMKTFKLSLLLMDTPKTIGRI